MRDPRHEARVHNLARSVAAGLIDDKRPDVRNVDVDLARACYEEHARHFDQACEHVAPVEGAGGVLDLGAEENATGIAVTRERDVRVHVRVLGCGGLPGSAGGPVDHGEGERGQHAGCLELDAVAVAVEVLEGGADGREDAAFPGADFFFEESRDDVYGVQVKMAANLVVLESVFVSADTKKQ